MHFFPSVPFENKQEKDKTLTFSSFLSFLYPKTSKGIIFFSLPFLFPFHSYNHSYNQTQCKKKKNHSCWTQSECYILHQPVRAWGFSGELPVLEVSKSCMFFFFLDYDLWECLSVKYLSTKHSTTCQEKWHAIVFVYLEFTWTCRFDLFQFGYCFLRYLVSPIGKLSGNIKWELPKVI